MYGERAGLRLPLLTGGQRLGITLAGHDQLRTLAPDSFHFGRGGNCWDKNFRWLFHQQVGKSAPHLEGTGMLQQFRLVDEANAVNTEVGALGFDYRSLPEAG